MDKALSFLDLSPKHKVNQWIPTKVVFIGAENYELGRVRAEVRIQMVEGGFQTLFKAPLDVPADLLLGKQIKQAMIYDIELRMPSLTLSAALLYPGSWPRVIREGESVGLRG